MNDKEQNIPQSTTDKGSWMKEARLNLSLGRMALPWIFAEIGAALRVAGMAAYFLLMAAVEK